MAWLATAAVFGPSIAIAADVPIASDARALVLMAQMRAASGGAALDRHEAFHETGTVIRDGHAGTYEMYGDLTSLRTAGVHTLDGKFAAGGFDGKAAWRVGPDGKLVVRSDPEAVREARSSAYFTIGGFNWPGRFPATFTSVGVRAHGSKSYDVVRVTPLGGTPNDLWLNRRTHQLERATTEVGGETASVEILANRRVDGTLVGFRNHQHEPGHDMDQSLATYDYVKLDPARLIHPSTDGIGPRS